MPDEFKEFGNLQNAITHFKNKNDEAERVFYAKPFELTR